MPPGQGAFDAGLAGLNVSSIAQILRRPQPGYWTLSAAAAPDLSATGVGCALVLVQPTAKQRSPGLVSVQVGRVGPVVGGMGVESIKTSAKVERRASPSSTTPAWRAGARIRSEPSSDDFRTEPSTDLRLRSVQLVDMNISAVSHILPATAAGAVVVLSTTAAAYGSALPTTWNGAGLPGARSSLGTADGGLV